tara:strand:+ start:395 stop:589 length:195 start_codon:yes stop_codon:yes gene_type:complete
LPATAQRLVATVAVSAEDKADTEADVEVDTVVDKEDRLATPVEDTVTCPVCSFPPFPRTLPDPI